MACWNLTKIKHLFLIFSKNVCGPWWVPPRGHWWTQKTEVFSGSSRKIFFREINSWLSFICFVGFGCFNGGTDSAFGWRHARFTRTWKREEQIGPLRTRYNMSKNRREFSFQNLPSDLKSYRTFREAGPWSVRSLLPWMGRSAWKLHIGLIIPPPSLLCSRY